MTRFEVLGVGLIVGVVALVSGVAVSMAREQTRDVTRLAHVRELQIGLALYFNDRAAYPVATDFIPLGQTVTACLSQDGFGAPCGNSQAKTTYLEFVPATPTPGLKGRSSCGGVADAYCYASTDGSYKIQFELERDNALLGLAKGLNCATEQGFSGGACPVAAATNNQ